MDVDASQNVHIWKDDPQRQDGVYALVGRQSLDEVHGDIFPNHSEERKGL